MKGFLTLFLLIATISFLPATQALDSLLVELDNCIADTCRVDILNKISIEFSYRMMDKKQEYAQQALDLARSCGYLPGVARAYCNLGFFEFRRGEYEKAEKFYSDAFKIYNGINDFKGMANCHVKTSLIFSRRGSYEIARDHLDKAYGFYDQAEYTAGVATCLINYGNLERSNARYPEAMEYYLTAQEKFEELGDLQSVSKCMNNVAMVCCRTGDYENAEKYYLQTLEINKKRDNLRGIGVAYHNLGAMNSDMGKYDKALEYYKQALMAKRRVQDKKGISSTLNNIGIIYRVRGDYDTAEDYYKQSLELKEELNYKKGIAGSLNNLGYLYYKKGDLRKAAQYCKSSLKIAREIGAKTKIRLACQYLSDIYAEMKEYKKAFEYHREYKAINDSIFNIDSEKSLAELQVKYDMENKEKANELLRKSNEIQALELEKQRNTADMLTIIIVLTVILAASFYMGYFYKRKSNKEIARQGEKLKKLNDELSRKNEQLYIQAVTDNLTKAYNRSYMMGALLREFNRGLRHGTEFGVVIFDLDDFKAINDRYGHLAGDFILSEIADLVRSIIRKEDLFCRYGGDEFVLVLSDTNIDQAAITAEKIRRAVKKSGYEFQESMIRLTLSMGVTDNKRAAPQSIDAIIQNADKAMYYSKQNGGNSVIIFDEE